MRPTRRLAAKRLFGLCRQEDDCFATRFFLLPSAADARQGEDRH
jgi:hypothetical protein